MGLNTYCYFVAPSAASEFVVLEDVTPEQVVAAPGICKFLTGDLSAPVYCYPPFPGSEAGYLRAQIARWGKGRIGAETVQDLSQETLAALSQAIDSHDPDRGVRFSTWLLAIAKYTLSDEFDRRMAQKRGSGKKPLDLEAAEQRFAGRFQRTLWPEIMGLRLLRAVSRQRNQLRLRGCIAGGLLCSSQDWVRVQ